MVYLVAQMPLVCKVGEPNQVDAAKRERELGIQLPDGARTIHIIRMSPAESRRIGVRALNRNAATSSGSS